MPTVIVIGPYRFFFYSSDRAEPAHIHVKRERCTVKFWLNPVSLEKSKGFTDHELLKIQRLVETNQALLLERWHEYFAA